MTTPLGDEAAQGPLLASKTDVGQVRQANEDSCDTFAREDGTQLLVVADGMGGHKGGATASRTAVDTIAETFEAEASARPADMLAKAIEDANARIWDMAQADPELSGMGTTVVAFHLDARGKGTVAHVGDSRAYRYRQGRLEPLTTDHSVVAEMQRRGLLSADEAAVHPRRNEILRSVGVLPEVDVEVADVEIHAGDRFVLCSDGLTGVVNDDEIAAYVQTETPEAAADQLIALANERGGPDNITVQILSIPASEADGDPEATAPVELSAVGIEAIESKRRQRARGQKIGSIVLVLIVAAAVYFAWQRLGGSPEPQASTRPAPMPAAQEAQAAAAETIEPIEPALESADRFEQEEEAPRRGIPRESDAR